MLQREFRKELLQKYARSREDDELIARILDKYEAWQRTGLMQSSRFLSERDRLCCEPVWRELGVQPVYWGGYPEAERIMAILPADWQDEEAVTHGEDCPVTVFRAHFRAEEPLSHRDFLGSLMGLGVERDTIGDIIVRDDTCDLIVTKEVSSYILQNLASAGRTALRLETISEAEAKPAEFRVIKDTVASLRLDAVVGSGFSLAREKAASAIRTGKVSVNGLECLKPDKAVEEGMKISLRGLGKIELSEVGGLSKKGRTCIVIKRFI